MSSRRKLLLQVENRKEEHETVVTEADKIHKSDEGSNGNYI